MTRRVRDAPRLLLQLACALALLAGMNTQAAAQADPQATAQDDPEEPARLNLEVAGLRSGSREQEAEPIAVRALQLAERLLGPDHPDTVGAVANLADIYVTLGRYREAEPLARRFLADSERVFGAEHPYTLRAIGTSAKLASELYRLDEAERLHRQLLTKTEASEPSIGEFLKKMGVLDAMIDLGMTLNLRGKWGEAEELLRRALGMADKDGHWQEAGRWNAAAAALAITLHDQGRLAEAEVLYREALDRSIRPSVRPGEGWDSRTITHMINLAGLYLDQERFAEAEPLFLRAIELREQLFGPDDPRTLSSVEGLALVYRADGRLSEAKPLMVRVVKARERLHGLDNPATLNSIRSLAGLNLRQGDLEGAKRLLESVASLMEAKLGADNPSALVALLDLGYARRLLGRHAEAEASLKRALDGFSQVFGPVHPLTLSAAEEYLLNQLSQGSTSAQLLEQSRLLLQGREQRGRSQRSQQEARAQQEREGTSGARQLALIADVAWAIGSAAPDRKAVLLPEAFRALQMASSGPADQSVAQQAARRYIRTQRPGLASLITQREQLETEWRQLEQRLSSFVSIYAGTEESAQILRRMEAIQKELDAIEGKLRADAPDFFALTDPSPIDVDAAKRMLGPDEIAMIVVPGPFGTHVVTISQGSIDWHRSAWDAERVRAAVQRLRWDSGARVTGTQEELSELQDEAATGPARYDRATAHALYQELIGPIAAKLAGKRRAYIAAGGALAGLPFSILVAAPPTGSDDDPEDLRATRWFGDALPLVHIPSLQSLMLLRAAASGPRGDGSFLGIGDPLLLGSVATRERGSTRTSFTSARLLTSSRSRNGGLVADVAELRNLPRLPGTAAELESIRLALKAPPSSLMLTTEATETKVRTADLSRHKIIVFSTHGLTADEATGVGQGGLVLTPPDEPSEQDDGYLAASEVAALDLDADWIILSACNTATGDGSQDAGLGQLARAFFFAGARNLLASHWPVSDDVAPILVTRTLELERAGVSRAEALQKAMREIREGRRDDQGQGVAPPPAEWAHPFYWAPFVLIGAAN